jgi:large subunit ribosomal protein L30
MGSEASGGRKLAVTLVRSPHGRLRSHQACVRGLGLRRTNSTAVVEDTPSIRGMITKVGYLLRVEEVSES